MNKINLKNQCGGFSLLEVLVAFTILAVTLGVLFQIYAKGTTSAMLGEEYAQAIVIAESRLAEFSIVEDLAGVGGSGRENEKYDWKVIIEDYIEEEVPEFSPTWLLQQVEVIVTWKSAGKSRSVNLQTLKPVPAT